jgi:hypothetical protein
LGRNTTEAATFSHKTSCINFFTKNSWATFWANFSQKIWSPWQYQKQLQQIYFSADSSLLFFA